MYVAEELKLKICRYLCCGLPAGSERHVPPRIEDGLLHLLNTTQQYLGAT